MQANYSFFSASAYLTPPASSFWSWNEMQEAVVWTDGRTIAFREELLPVIRNLAPRGLPRFGALLLLIAATRDSWNTTAHEPGLLAGMLGPVSEDRRLLAEVLAGLDRVSEFESFAANTPAAKSLLAEVVFEAVDKVVQPADVPNIVSLLEGTYRDHLDSFVSLAGAEDPARSLRADLLVLYPGLSRLAERQLRQRQDTGLDDLPQPADLDLPLPEQVRSLLRDLQQDDELAGLARVARQLMAAVTLPRATSDPDDLEMGGVSDVTNRGPLDRLLVSELAHDDLTLAVRVATGEAMYLRREAPPRTPQRTRVLLLESGIRSWGVPRVFGCAVALAMAGTLDTHTEFRAFRASAKQVVPAVLHEASGLRAHLAALETEIHPGDCLPALMQEIESFADSELEPVLIVTEDTAADANFQRALLDAGFSNYFLATVDRIGRFRLLQRTARGTKLIREARLDLETLFEEKRSAKAVIDGPIDRDLPAIFALRDFPLRMSHALVPKRFWSAGRHGALAATRDRRLMWWVSKNTGAIQLNGEMPSGDILWQRPPLGDSKAYAIFGNFFNHLRSLVTFDVETNEVDVKPINMDTGEAEIVSHRDGLFVIRKRHVEIYSLQTGERFPDMQRINMQWRQGRFFIGRPMTRWWALSYDGIEPRFDFVLDEKQTRNCPPLNYLLDHVGSEGPIGITGDGKLFLTAKEEVVDLGIRSNRQVQVDYVAADGREVIARVSDVISMASGTMQKVLINVDTRTFETLPPRVGNRVVSKAMHQFVTQRSLRHRFVRIARDEQNRLVLTTRKQTHLAITLRTVSPERPWLSFEQRDMTTLRASRSFKDVKHEQLKGIKLRVATWDDGSKAFLDSRGLLHLKSSRGDIPEVTIVLCDGMLSGWRSDGHFFGDMYYLGDHESENAASTYRAAIEPFCRELR